MARAKRIVLAFGAAGKPLSPSFWAQGADAVAAAGKNLVRIGLMANVPDDAIMGVSKTACSATVNSITPSPAPRWPPVTETASITSARSSSARARRFSRGMARRSAGVDTVSSRGVSGLSGKRAILYQGL